MKLSALSGLTPAKASGKTPRIPLNVDDETHALLTQYVPIASQFKTLKSQKETIGAQLAAGIKRAWFTAFGGITPPEGTLVADVDGQPIKLIIKDAYSKALADDAQLRAVLGDDVVDRYFHTSTLVKLDFDKIPEDKAEAFADAVVKAAQDLDVMTALEVKEYVAPRAGFHESRTRLLTPEQNEALDQLMPITAFAMP